MANSTTTVISYPNGDFASGINLPVLEEEAKAALSGETLNSVVANPGAVVFEFAGLLLAADITTLDGVVAAHNGADFASLTIRQVALGLQSNDSQVETDVVVLDPGGPLQAGEWSISWAIELAATSTEAGNGCLVKLHTNKNGGGYVARLQDFNDDAEFKTFGTSLPDTLKAGDTLSVKLTFERRGATPNAARVRTAIVGLQRVGPTAA